MKETTQVEFPRNATPTHLWNSSGVDMKTKHAIQKPKIKETRRYNSQSGMTALYEVYNS